MPPQACCPAGKAAGERSSHRKSLPPPPRQHQMPKHPSLDMFSLFLVQLEYSLPSHRPTRANQAPTGPKEGRSGFWIGWELELRLFGWSLVWLQPMQSSFILQVSQIRDRMDEAALLGGSMDTATLFWRYRQTWPNPATKHSCIPLTSLWQCSPLHFSSWRAKG